MDDVFRGHPTYNNFRSDISTLFPGYANSSGAVAYFSLDTTTLSNGVHTLAWGVVDNAGRSAGIGSRYFTVANGAGSTLAETTIDTSEPHLGGNPPLPLVALRDGRWQRSHRCK